MAKYIGWELKPFETIYVIQSKNPLEYYRLASKQNFIKLLCILPDENEINALKSVLRNNKFEFEHNNHILSAETADKLIIAKCFRYSTIIKGQYSLKKFSSYDIIWIIEKDIISLKKKLSKCFIQLPPDIPKLAIVNEAEAGTNKSFIFRNYGIRTVIDLNKSTISEIDRNKRKDLIYESIEVLKNPEGSLTHDFIAEYQNKSINHYPITLGIITVGALAFLLYKYNSKK